MSTLDIDFYYYYFHIGFTASALLTPWAGSFLCVCGDGCPVHFRVFSSISSFHPLDASSTHPPSVPCGNRKFLQTLPNVLCEDKNNPG